MRFELEVGPEVKLKGRFGTDEAGEDKVDVGRVKVVVATRAQRISCATRQGSRGGSWRKGWTDSA